MRSSSLRPARWSLLMDLPCADEVIGGLSLSSAKAHMRREGAHGKNRAQGLAAAVVAGCLCIMDGIAAGGRPIDRGVVCVRRWRRLEVRRRPRLKVRKWPRLTQVVVVMMVVTMRRFLSEGIARKAGRQSDRSDKAFDHQSVFPMRKRRASLGRVPTLFRIETKAVA
jgi:hypothetical protein